MTMGKPKTALVLSGGGARGAYQAGVLKGLLQLGVLGHGNLPFDILVGTSAGSINSATLAAYADRVEKGVDELVQVWSRVRAPQVFRTDVLAIAHTAWQWIRDLSFGGLIGNVRPKALLNTSPLRGTLSQIPFERISRHIEADRLQALAIGATNYYTTNGVLFLEGKPDLPLWHRARYHVEKTRIRVEHLLASSAIPLFFPAVEIDGRYFGDGCIRNTAPLSPAIQLGAQKIVAVGVRESLGPSEDDVLQGARPLGSTRTRHAHAPHVATIAGVLLDAVMIDAIESDIDHCSRINRSVHALDGAPVADDGILGSPHGGGGLQLSPTEAVQRKISNFRHIDVLWLRPSISFATVAGRLESRIPPLIRYLLRGLGDDRASSELASYLLFDWVFCNELISQGEADVAAQENNIREFFAR